MKYYAGIFGYTKILFDPVSPSPSLPSSLYCRDEIKECLRLLHHDAHVMLLLSSSSSSSSSSHNALFDKFDMSTDAVILWGNGKEVGGRLVPALMYDTWKYNFNDSRLSNHHLLWCCRECFVQFSIFTGKYHCLRCRSLFCNLHAPTVEITKCIPTEKMESNIDTLRKEERSLGGDTNWGDKNCNFLTNKSIETVRLCKTCDFEIFNAGGVLQVII